MQIIKNSWVCDNCKTKVEMDEFPFTWWRLATDIREIGKKSETHFCTLDCVIAGASSIKRLGGCQF